MYRNRWFHGPWALEELPAEAIADCSASGLVDDAVDFWVDRLGSLQ